MIKQTLTILFVIISILGYCQEYYTSNTIVEKKISYRDLKENGYGKKLFQVLAIDNKTDARKLALKVKFQLIIKLENDQNQDLQLFIQLNPVSINGNINIRDFSVDTLLWPSGYSGQLVVKNSNHIRDKIKIEGLCSGVPNNYDLSDYNQNIGEITVSLEDVEFEYDIESYTMLESKAESIVYYYSYCNLLDQLNSLYNSKSVIADPVIADIFIQKVELDRIDLYIRTHNFDQDLNLSNRDPLKFLKKQKKFQRLRKRAQTLFNQQLLLESSNNTNSLEFCKLYYLLSSEYLTLAAKLQPSDASGYKEIASILGSMEEEENLQRILSYYNQNTNSKHYLENCISEGFISLAEEKNIDNNFTDALLLLNNSRTIYSWFGMDNSSNFLSAVNSSVGGIANSHLSVGYMALKTGNIQFASKYITSANKLILDNTEVLEKLAYADSSLMDLINLQLNIAVEYSNYKLYDESFNSLFIAKQICSYLVQPDSCLVVDSVDCQIKDSYIENEIVIFESLISTFQYPDAYDRFISMDEFLKNYNCGNIDILEKYKELSDSLYLVFLKQGEILSKANQVETAIENFKTAKSIQETLGGDIAHIERMILFSAEPLIQRVIENAKYDTWANKMDDAQMKYENAIRLNQKYFNGSNPRIDESLIMLKTQMDLRICLDHKNDFQDAIKTAEILIRDGNYEKLPKLISDARNIADNYPKCEIKTGKLDKLEAENRVILTFLSSYSLIKTNLFNRGYNSVVEQYHTLEDYYVKNNIRQYNIKFHSQYDFIAKQKQPNLTIEAIKYFISINQPEDALAYLKLYKSHDGYTKEIKGLTATIAKILAKNDDTNNIPSNEALTRYTQGNSNLNYFKLVYIKNRVVKTQD